MSLLFLHSFFLGRRKRQAMERDGAHVPARFRSRFANAAALSSRSSTSPRPCFICLLLGKLLSVILTFVFAAVGSMVGAMTGAVVGQATESGFFRGASIGAISGAVFSLEVYESSLLLWHSDVSGYWSLLYVIYIFKSLLSGRLVREKVGPAMLSAVQSQMSSFEANSGDVVDFFPIGETNGLSVDLVELLPKMTISKTNNIDQSGDKIICSVCLQDFQTGERVRSLPQCQHMFHLPCIDSWLIRHGTCPLCRRDL